MDYASFKLNLEAFGLETKATEDAILSSYNQEQVGKIFLDRVHSFTIDTSSIPANKASRLLNNIWLFSATPTNLRRVSE